MNHPSRRCFYSLRARRLNGRMAMIVLLWLFVVSGFAVPCWADIPTWFRDLLTPTSHVPPANVAQVIVRESDAVSMGSATLIWVEREYGWLLTNWHVVRGSRGPVEVVFPCGFRSPAEVLKLDPKWDLALLASYRPPVVPMPLSREIPRVGDVVSIAGYGQGQFRMARGTCRNYAAPELGAEEDLIDVSVPARQGDSGGPMINQRGELVGVLFGSGSGMTTGTHIGRVQRFLRESGGTWGPRSTPERVAARNVAPQVAPDVSGNVSRDVSRAMSVAPYQPEQVPPPFFASATQVPPTDRSALREAELWGHNSPGAEHQGTSSPAVASSVVETLGGQQRTVERTRLAERREMTSIGVSSTVSGPELQLPIQPPLAGSEPIVRRLPMVEAVAPPFTEGVEPKRTGSALGRNLLDEAGWVTGQLGETATFLVVVFVLGVALHFAPRATNGERGA